jgi:hypothetical protein
MATMKLLCTDRPFFDNGYGSDAAGVRSMHMLLELYPAEQRIDIGFLSGHNGVEDLLEREPQPTIAALRCNVDRGILGTDLPDKWPSALQHAFPNLRCLFIHQNYSFTETYAPHQQAWEAFLQHPFIRQLTHFAFEDIQSGFDISPLVLQKSLPVKGNALRMCGFMGTWEHVDYVHEHNWPHSHPEDVECTSECADLEPETNWKHIPQVERARLQDEAVKFKYELRAPRPGCDFVRMTTVQQVDSTVA